MVFTPPASESQRVAVVCRRCQKEVLFQVDSPQLRMQKRLRAIFTWGGGLMVSIALGLLSTYTGQATHMAWWVYLIWWGHTMLFFWSVGGIYTLVPYIGVKSPSLPPGHRVRFPEKNELILLSQTARVAGES